LFKVNRGIGECVIHGEAWLGLSYDSNRVREEDRARQLGQRSGKGQAVQDNWGREVGNRTSACSTTLVERFFAASVGQHGSRYRPPKNCA